MILNVLSVLYLFVVAAGMFFKSKARIERLGFVVIRGVLSAVGILGGIVLLVFLIGGPAPTVPLVLVIVTGIAWASCFMFCVHWPIGF